MLTLADSGKSPPDFGVPTPPDAIRTVRVVKEVLPVGKHKAGYDESGNVQYWNVDSPELAQILNDFQAQKTAGETPNLGKTHGDDDLIIHPDDLIAPIDDMKIVGDSLWMSSYVTPEQAEYLSNPARKTSIAVIPNHNYAGKVYKRYVAHVAVTDRPAVPGLSTFLALADSGGSMNPELLDAINMLMEAAGLSKLGEVADETDLISQLKGVAAALGKKVESGEAIATPTTEAPLDSLEMTGVPPAMKDAFKKLSDNLLTRVTERDEEIKTLKDELKKRQDAEKTAVKAAFDAKCEEVMKVPDARGYVATKADVDAVKALADSLGYDLRLLATINRPQKLGGSVARAMADATPPKVASNDSANLRDPEARKATAERIAAKRGIKLEDAMKMLPVVG